jgi:hypothetical protein
VLSFFSANSAKRSHIVAICRSSALSLTFCRCWDKVHAFGCLSPMRQHHLQDIGFMIFSRCLPAQALVKALDKVGFD